LRHDLGRLAAARRWFSQHRSLSAGREIKRYHLVQATSSERHAQMLFRPQLPDAMSFSSAPQRQNSEFRLAEVILILWLLQPPPPNAERRTLNAI
jgi:hypothetical protein